MSATCQNGDCRWRGNYKSVREGGLCPKCGEAVVYSNAPIAGHEALDVDEFNQRAARALKQIASDSPFIANVLPRMERGVPLTGQQQNNVYHTILRYEARINDRQVVEFATHHAKGAS